jgi:hypothetical protein
MAQFECMNRYYHKTDDWRPTADDRRGSIIDGQDLFGQAKRMFENAP